MPIENSSAHEAPALRSIANGWTGGQYSLFRAIFGIYLLQHFLFLLPWGTEMFSNRGALADAALSPLAKLFPNILSFVDAPAMVAALLAAGAVLSVFFLIGKWDRAAAVGLWYVWACLVGRNPLIANPSLPYVGWMLLAHACLPAAPYGAWAARDRADAAGGWHLPREIFAVGWLLMAVGYSYSGYMKLESVSWVDGSALRRVLENPLARPTFLRVTLLALPPVLLKLATWGALGLELLFAPLALIRRLRPWIWVAMLGLHVGLFTMLDFADLTAGMVLLHWWTFDPAWIPARRAAATEMLFYDGHCGLCHRAVRFVLAEDRSGSAFQFAPLQGEFFQQQLSEEEKRGLPDSLVLRTADGRLLTRSSGVLHLMARLGGTWRLLSAAASVVPAKVRDAAYDFVARVRYKLFAQPSETCPLMPAGVRGRFRL